MITGNIKSMKRNKRQSIAEVTLGVMRRFIAKRMIIERMEAIVLVRKGYSFVSNSQSEAPGGFTMRRFIPRSYHLT